MGECDVYDKEEDIWFVVAPSKAKNYKNNDRYMVYCDADLM